MQQDSKFPGNGNNGSLLCIFPATLHQTLAMAIASYDDSDGELRLFVASYDDSDGDRLL